MCFSGDVAHNENTEKVKTAQQYLSILVGKKDNGSKLRERERKSYFV